MEMWLEPLPAFPEADPALNQQVAPEEVVRRQQPSSFGRVERTRAQVLPNSSRGTYLPWPTTFPITMSAPSSRARVCKRSTASGSNQSSLSTK